MHYNRKKKRNQRNVNKPNASKNPMNFDKRDEEKKKFEKKFTRVTSQKKNFFFKAKK